LMSSYMAASVPGLRIQQAALQENEHSRGAVPRYIRPRCAVAITPYMQVRCECLVYMAERSTSVDI